MSKIVFNKGGNPANPKAFEIPTTALIISNLIKPGDQSVKLIWKYIGDGPDIVFTKPGCGCTANVEYVGDTIVAYFNETVVTKDGNNITQVDKQKGYKEITKSLRVFLDDGKPLKVISGMSENFNQVKTSMQIQFTIKVDISEFIKPGTINPKDGSPIRKK